MPQENTVGECKQTDVSKAVNNLYQSIEALEGRVQLLITRLNSVLVSKQKCTENKKENELTQCELAKSIRGAEAHINKIMSMVNDTIEDIEI